MVLLVIHEDEIGRLLGKRGSKLAEYKQNFGVKIKVGGGNTGSFCKLIPVEIFNQPDSDEGMDKICKQQMIRDLQEYVDCYSGNRDLMESDTPPNSPQIEGAGICENPVIQSEHIESIDPKSSDISESAGFGAQQSLKPRSSNERSNMLSESSSLYNNEVLEGASSSVSNFPHYGFQTTRNGFEDDGWPKLDDPWGGRDKGGFDPSTIHKGVEGNGWSNLSDDEFGAASKDSQRLDTGAELSKGRNYQDMLATVRGMTLHRDPKTLPPVVKDFYREHSEVSKFSESQILAIRKEKNDVQVRDLRTDNQRIPPRITTKFEHSLQDYPELLDEVEKNKFTEPSPIQCQVWPIVLSGHDCIGIAQTGTGKTLAFLFPAFIHIMQQAIPRRERDGPTVLVLSPTRELAQQIDREVRKYNYKEIKSACLTGGNSRNAQVDLIGRGVDIVIVTPGRMNDLICSGDLRLDFISYVVLDEADRMLDMGFEEQIRDMLNTVRKDKHTIMTSATWPPQVQKLALKYMSEPFLVSIGSLDLKACHNVKQEILIMQESQKKAMLKTIMQDQKKGEKYLIFCSKKRTVDEVNNFLTHMGCKNMKMHGDVMQSDRERALRYLKRGECPVVVASDVAARGLDIMDITHVINYDMAQNNDDYVHRIGRTGRAGRKGVSVTFFTSSDSSKATKLVQVLEEAKQTVPPELLEMARTSAINGAANGGFYRHSSSSQNGESSRRSDRPREMVDPLTGEVIGVFTCPY